MVSDIQKGTEKGLKETGLNKVMAILKSTLVGFKPLISVVKKLIKFIEVLLQPIAMILTILLRPLLMLLRPIVRVMKEFLEPFRELARGALTAGKEQYQAGNKGMGLLTMSLASLNMLTGLNLFFLTIAKEAIKFILMGLTTLVVMFIDAVIPFININAYNVANLVGNTVDSIFTLFSDAIIDSLDIINKNFGVETKGFANSAKAEVRDLTFLLDDVITKNAREHASNRLLIIAHNAIMEFHTKNEAKKVKEAGVNKVNEIINKAVEKARSLIKKAKEESGLTI